MAQVSYGTITITDTTDIERIYVVYAKHTSNTDTSELPNTNTWTESIASAPGSGNYIWQRTVVKKSGINELTYGNPVCITGPEGPQGDEARNIIAVTPYYYLSTSNSNQTGGSWSTTPQTYPSTGTYYYWTKTVTTYDSGNPSESEPVLDMFLTNAAKDARDANGTAQDAWNKADDAQTNASNALGVATSINQHFWSIETDYATGIPAGSYVTDTAIETYKSQKTGGNLLTRSDGIWIRNGINTLAALTGSSLNFYKPGTSNIAMLLTSASLVFNNPSTSNKAMELSSGGLVFYDGSAENGGNIQAQFGSSGAIQSGDYIINATTDKFSRSGTKIDLTNGEIYSPYFRLSQGKVSGGPVAGIYMSGTFESTGALIGYQKTSNSDTNAYWKIGYMTDTNQDRLVLQRANDVGFIELAPSSTFIIQKNKIHTGWFGNNGYLTYPQFRVNSNNIYYDFGMNLPTSLTDKFLYVRYNTGSNLSAIYQNDSGWVYPFYVDAEGNINAHSISIDGVPMSGGSLIAGSLSSYGGTYNRPVYFPSDGTNKGKPVQIEVTDNTSATAVTSNDTNLITARTLYYAGYVKSSGITSVTIAATSPVVSSTNTAQTGSSASTTISLANAYGDTKNPYGAKTKNYVLAGPASGSAAAPTFRALVAADIPDLSETYLTSYTETDPIFTASAAYGITSSDITNWNSKTSNTGTVTSVAAGGNGGITISGSPITTSGTITVGLNLSTAINGLGEGTSSATRDDYIVAQYAGGGTTTTTYHRRKLSNIFAALNKSDITTALGYTPPTQDTDTHYTTHLYVNNGTTTNKNTTTALTNGNVYLHLYDDSTKRDSHKISGSGTVSVTSDNSGNIVITGSAHPTALNGVSFADGVITFTKTDGNSTTIQTDNFVITQATGATALVGTDTNHTPLSVNGPVKFTNGVPVTMRPATSSGLYLKDDGTWGTPGGTYSLPLAANGTRGGIQIGFTTSAANRNYAVALSSEKAYVNVPWTDRYVNSAGFTDDTTNSSSSPVKMTLTRAGSDTNTVTANIPKVSSSSAGVAPKGASVNSQSQSTKFLREDGTWATPSYTTNTNTATAADNILDGSNSGTEITYAPYTSRQSGLSFYTGTTAPNGTTRLNLNGYLYATKLYSGGTEVLTAHQSLSNYKTKQTAISAPTATTNKWVNTLAQNANGEITVTYSSLDTSGTWSGNATKLGTTTIGGTGTPIYLDSGSPKAITSAISVSLGGTGTTSLTSGAALIGNGTGAVGTRSITNQTSGAVTASTNLVTANSLVAHTNSVVGNYVAKSGDTMTGSLTTPELIATKIKAGDVNVTHLLTAEDIQTKNWTAVNMATIDGSFYIVPTVSIKAEGGAKLSYNAEGGTITLTAQGSNSFATNSLYIDDNAMDWTTNSLAMFTGSVKIDTEFVPIGTIKGTITGVSTTQITLGSLTTDTGETPSILSLLGSGHNCKDLKVSIYSYYNNSNSTDNLLGIMMTTAGAGNRTYIDIYDGTNETNSKTSTSGFTYTEPVVRVGNLNGLNSYTQANGAFTVTPKGWGIYTTNGFFVGDVYAENGYIGGFTIGKSDLNNGALGSTNSVWVSTGTSDSTSIGGSEDINNWAFTAGKQFGVTTDGTLYASNGIIGGTVKIGDSVRIGSTNSTDLSTLAANVHIEGTGSISLGDQNGFHIFIDGSDSKSTTYGIGFYQSNHNKEYVETIDTTPQTDKNYYTKDGNNNYTKFSGNTFVTGTTYYEEIDKRIAYLNNQQLFIPRTVVLKEMRIGSEWTWERNDFTKNLTLKWRG